METVSNFYKKLTGFAQSGITILKRNLRLIHVIHMTDDDDDKQRKKRRRKEDLGK